MNVLLALLLLGGCPSDQPTPEPTPAVDRPEADAGPNRVVEVGTPITLDGTASTGAEAWAWDFGDGAVGEGPTPTHTYEEPGHHVVVLTAADALGRTSTDSLVVTVHEPAASEEISNPSALVGDGERLWAVLPDFDSVVVVDADSAQVLDHLPVCVQPRSLALRGDRLAVACAGDDAVEVWTTGGDFVLRHEFAFGSAPFAAAWQGEALRVTLQATGQVVEVSAAGAQTAEDLGPDLRGLAIRGDAAFVTRFRSPDAAGEAWFDGALIPLARDPGPDSDTGARGVPTYLQRVAIGPAGRRAAVVGLQANVERGLFREGRALTHETTARATLRVVDLDLGLQSAASFDDRDLASAIAWSPLGDWLYVAMHGMETVEVLDAWTLERTGGFLDVGRGPSGLWADDDRVWVLCGLSRELVAFPVQNLGAPQEELARVDLVPASGEVLDAQILRGKQIFHRSADVRMTKDGYVSCGSCHLEGDADGRTWDFTDRGEGLRNTISLLGRGGSVPIHWTGNFDEVQDFENDVRGPQQGAGFLTDADWERTSDTLGEPKAGLSDDLDALAAYVESLTQAPRSPGAILSTTEGQDLFEDPTVGCADCHPAPTYTDSAFLAPGQPLLHDVGTLSDGSGQRLGQELLGIDTPHLVGLHGSAPYLHDGSAETLMDVLVARNPGDEHGVTSHLSDEQLVALEGFLLSL